MLWENDGEMEIGHYVFQDWTSLFKIALSHSPAPFQMPAIVKQMAEKTQAFLRGEWGLV